MYYLNNTLQKNQSKFTTSITLSAGDYRGSRMGLTVLVNSQPIYQSARLESDLLSLEFEMTAPGKIQFIVSGKLPGQTEVDRQGNILSDKFIRIDRLVVNHIPLKGWALENRILDFETDNGNRRLTNYFGENGTAHIVFEKDLLLFFLNATSKLG